jgi:hypothetical protein
MHLYRIFEKKEEFHSDFSSTFLCREDISGRRYMRGFYNDVARLQVCLSLSTLTQPNSISALYMVLLSCRMCVKYSLIAAQIWNRGRLSPDLLKL